MQCPSCNHVASPSDFGLPPRCPDCGIYYEKALSLKPSLASSPAKPNESSGGEKVFLEGPGVKVTNARFIVNKQTFAMATVNSVKVVTLDKTPDKAVQYWMIAIGAAWGMFLLFNRPNSLMSFLWPAALAGLGFLWARSVKKIYEYRLVLTTSSGEVNVLSSSNLDEIRKIEAALNDVIVYRG